MQKNSSSIYCSKEFSVASRTAMQLVIPTNILSGYQKTAAAKPLTITSHFVHCDGAKLDDVQLPLPLKPLSKYLRSPNHAYICEMSGCEELSVSRDAIRRHRNKKHD